MNGLTNRNNWIISKCDNILNDKDAMRNHLIFTMLNKSVRMFKYSGLPDSIKHKDLETLLQVNGFCVWKRVNGELYVFFAGLGGVPNPYYLPTKAIISNPALRYNEELTIDSDCVVMLNDYYYQGMMPLFAKYSSLLVEAEISLKIALWNSRVPALASADTDNAYESAEEFFENIVKGDKYGAIATDGFFEGLKVHPFAQGNRNITEIIEAIQYIKGSWYNEIGLNASFNMKREAINEAEANINNDILFPVIDAMLDCRKSALEKVNKMFGTNITVELDSTWNRNVIKEDLGIEEIESQIDEQNTGGDDVEQTEN